LPGEFERFYLADSSNAGVGKHMQRQSIVRARVWDVVIGLVATASVLLIPLDLLDDFPVEPSMTAAEWLMTLIYGIDAVVRYRRRGAANPEERIAWLAVDVLAALPLYPLFGTTVSQLPRLLKLIRVAQLLRALRRRQVRSGNVLRLGPFIYGLGLSAHWIACGWAMLYGSAGGADPFTRYTRALYWCISTLTTVGYGDITPTNNAQNFYAIGVMILGVGVYAYIIGNIASIITNLDPAKAAHLRQLERMQAFMHYRQLPPALQQRIREYYDYLWNQRLGYDETTLLESLPPSLRTEISLYLKRGLIERVPLFQGASDGFIREIALQLESVVYMPGDVIVRAGDRGRDMYFINRGSVEVLAPDHRTVYNTLTAGNYFGEIALTLDQPRTATVRALEYCDLYRLDKVMYERILADYSDIAVQIAKRAQERQQRGT
jgi:voltage-gated potassium channel